MVCSQVADGGEGLQIGRVAVNVLNKQLQTASKEWSSRLGVGWEANNSYHKKSACYEMLHRLKNRERERCIPNFGWKA
jgi:hypothetical protein